MNHKKFQINHPCGCIISDSLKKTEMDLVNNCEIHDMENGYIWYWLSPTQINGKDISIRLCFFYEELELVSLNIEDSNLYGENLNDYNVYKEKLCAKHTGEWLESIGYPEGQYSWGSIWVGLDLKSGFGQSVISFKR